MKKMLAIALSLSLLAPTVQAKGLMKKLIIGGAIVYGANALAKNQQQNQYPQQYPNQPYQQPGQYGQRYDQNNPQYYRNQQYYPNQVDRPYSPNY